MLEMAAASDRDPFGDLPDELLSRVLSFLPAEDALQTCVLETRWRDLWRRLTSLRFVFDGPTFPRYNRFKRLVKLLICLRGNSPLIRCEIDAYPDDEPENMFTNTRLLIDYALACEAEELIVRAADIQYDLPVFDVPLSLISQHLKTLHLEGVNLDHSALKFSGCLVLEDLRIQLCNIRACEISSMSLKRLCITDYCSLPDIVRLRICAPSLISLQLEDFEGLTPFLENMPLLETAHVNLEDGCHDHCRSNQGVCDNIVCGCHAYPVKEGVLLNGLSNAAKLDLIALPKMFLYRSDLKWCPIFGKLKTLLLNEWFTAVDLVCILRQSPVLESLTLKLGNTEDIVGATGAQETKTQSFVCACLKSVYIECEEVDEGVLAVLNILSTCGILRDQISIKEDSRTDSDCFGLLLEPFFGLKDHKILVFFVSATFFGLLLGMFLECMAHPPNPFIFCIHYPSV
ncbi:hypothetical protein CFC21_089934 [Triticum aestivum]|uniref:F-box domain-containing protein n=2 Tax=Triticum aestivum TaxID=4565 RepID=A0A341ZK18_WHEAT|nr:putative FBD-associated F-box protein At5g38570 isoform X2 [Triticum aestivum]KAF7086655.1 hypothetical protein CFC21_089934 [Triticum aestivum]